MPSFVAAVVGPGCEEGQARATTPILLRTLVQGGARISRTVHG